MRHVVRNESAPTALLKKGKVELEKAADYFGPPRQSPKAFNFKAYKIKEVKDALERIFKGKCAYCETFYAGSQPMDVEHYRPKGAVAGDDAHPGYWWIAMEWANLLPSCIDCNRKRNQSTPQGNVSQVRLLEETLQFTNSTTQGSGKKDSFPLAEGGVRALSDEDGLVDEKALLLNPCDPDIEDHLEFYFDFENPISFVLPKRLQEAPTEFVDENGLSIKGGTSIHIYGLNRLRLVQARTEILRRLEFLGNLVIELKALAEEITAENTQNALLIKTERALSGFADSIIVEINQMSEPTMPYSAMVSAWIDAYSNRVEP